MVVIDHNDLGKTKIQILMDLIYESDKIRIPEEHIHYGKPRELDARPAVLTDPNTFIPVRIDRKYDKRFNKRSGFMYRRRGLGDHLNNLPDPIIIDVWPVTTRQLLITKINPQLDYPIDPADIEDRTLTDPNSTKVLFTSSKDSFLWCGKFNATVVPINSDYFKLVTVQSLDGFNQYQG